MKLMAAVGLAVAALVGNLGTPAIEQQSHEREFGTAQCMGVFGADQASLSSRLVPACLTGEPADDCAARLAGIERERRHVANALRHVQGALAGQGIVAPDRYLMLARYLVATSCSEGL